MGFVKFLAFLMLFSASTYANFTNNGSGGYIIPQEKFPFALKIHIDGNRCTGSLVGRRIILTAAHCFRSNNRGYFTVGNKKYYFNAYKYSELMLAPEDREKNDLVLDFAVGILEKEVAEISPQEIDTTGNHGLKRFLLGYGCHGNLNITFFAPNKVQNDQKQYIINSDQNLIILSGNNDEYSRGCSGDSGGPYTTFDFEGKIKIVSIHLGSGQKQASPNSFHRINYTYSLKLSSPAVIAFLKKSSESFGVGICGFNQSCL